MSNGTKKKRKKFFHAPEKKGEVTKIEMTKEMQILSVVSLVLLIGLTVFAIYGMIVKKDTVIALSENFYMQAEWLLIFMPVVAWMIAVGFRLACRQLPLEMWRLSKKVKKGTIMNKGKLLKTTTLLLELETVICFWYITVMIYRGHAPADIAILIWVVLLFLTVFLSSDRASKIADGLIRA